MPKKTEKQVHCWEFFHCDPQDQKNCLLSQVEDKRCWLLDIACCKMDRQAPRPKSVKKVLCKTCAFYKTFKEPSDK